MTANIFERLGAFFSLGLLCLLAMAAWLLSEIALRPQWTSSTKSPKAVNAYVDNSQIIQTGSDGTAHYWVQTPRLTLFENGASEVQEPKLMALGRNTPPVLAQADRGLVSANQSRLDFIELRGQVQIRRAAYQNESAIFIATDWVRFDVNEKIAQTDAPVRVQQGGKTLSGTGMRFDQKTERLEILSQTQMVVPGSGATP